MKFEKEGYRDTYQIRFESYVLRSSEEQGSKNLQCMRSRPGAYQMDTRLMFWLKNEVKIIRKVVVNKKYYKT